MFCYYIRFLSLTETLFLRMAALPNDFQGWGQATCHTAAVCRVQGSVRGSGLSLALQHPLCIRRCQHLPRRADLAASRHSQGVWVLVLAMALLGRPLQRTGSAAAGPSPSSSSPQKFLEPHVPHSSPGSKGQVPAHRQGCPKLLVYVEGI